MIGRPCITIVAAVFVVAILAPAGRGQTAPPYREGGSQVPREQVRGAGEIKGMRGDLLHVANAEGAQWLVKVPEDPRNIRVTGSAKPEFLQPGMMVRFTGRFNSQGVAQEPIRAVDVFPVFPPRPGARANPREGEQPAIGVFPDSRLDSANLFADPDAAAPKNAVASFKVAGQLRGLRDGDLIVAAGNTLVRVPLADDAVVKVEIADLRWAQVGDRIEFDGWAFPQAKSNVYGNRITVQAAKELGVVQPPKKPAVKPADVPAPAPPEEDLPF